MHSERMADSIISPPLSFLQPHLNYSYIPYCIITLWRGYQRVPFVTKRNKTSSSNKNQKIPQTLKSHSTLCSVIPLEKEIIPEHQLETSFRGVMNCNISWFIIMIMGFSDPAIIIPMTITMIRDVIHWGLWEGWLVRCCNSLHSHPLSIFILLSLFFTL